MPDVHKPPLTKPKVKMSQLNKIPLKPLKELLNGPSIKLKGPLPEVSEESILKSNTSVRS